VRPSPWETNGIGPPDRKSIYGSSHKENGSEAYLGLVHLLPLLLHLADDIGLDVQLIAVQQLYKDQLHVALLQRHQLLPYKSTTLLGGPAPCFLSSAHPSTTI